MNPLPVILADLRSLRWVAIAVPLLVAIAVAVGVAIGAQERALRTSSARAADDFDLLVGAPGSQTQLVLTTIYLQPEALPLIPGSVLNDLVALPGVRAAAPIAFGDVVRGYPVVGTTRDFAGRWGRLTPTAGRLFAAAGEAVVGADVALALGAEVTPSHLVGGRHPLLGVEDPEEAEHRHGGERYRVVGTLPRLGSPWDRAILVPVESVWQTHGLGTGHAAPEAPLGPPFDAETVPGVPAIVVKPRSVSDAYALRGRYRSGATMAFFPAEALVPLYRAMGDVRDIMVVASALNNGLILAATTLLLLALAGLRRKRYAALRALGAPPAYILLAVWLGAVALLGAGSLAGLGAGFALTAALSGLVAARTGLALAVTIDWSDLAFVMVLLMLASMLALVPALASYRRPVAAALREQV